MYKKIMTTNDKLRVLKMTKELYVKQFTVCLINKYRIGDLSAYEPMGLCDCFASVCEDYDYRYYSVRSIYKVIPEWHRELAYKITPPLLTSDADKSDIEFGYWYPIWDKASRINFLNWLISRYTLLSTK